MTTEKIVTIIYSFVAGYALCAALNAFVLHKSIACGLFMLALSIYNLVMAFSSKENQDEHEKEVNARINSDEQEKR